MSLLLLELRKTSLEVRYGETTWERRDGLEDEAAGQHALLGISEVKTKELKVTLTRQLRQ